MKIYFDSTFLGPDGVEQYDKIIEILRNTNLYLCVSCNYRWSSFRWYGIKIICAWWLIGVTGPVDYIIDLVRTASTLAHMAGTLQPASLFTDPTCTRFCLFAMIRHGPWSSIRPVRVGVKLHCVRSVTVGTVSFFFSAGLLLVRINRTNCRSLSMFIRSPANNYDNWGEQ